MPTLMLETASGEGIVAGIDEAGCGPLAGPVVAAAFVFLAHPAEPLAELIDDSKRLSPERRDVAYAALVDAARGGLVAYAAAAASAAEIGRLNIRRATHLAMARALARLAIRPDLVLVDGNAVPQLPVPARCVVGGDRTCLSIAAASIIAKVLRDRAMRRLACRHPHYGWEANMGYPTASHRAALAAFGATRHHRSGFGPVDLAPAPASPPIASTESLASAG
ncbi:ribonuclease HII [Elioraea rosea]|uniref:ribonuclease HII n=1 Tax=Elioraea rosea TaxID=2492390 RepID=UPI0038D02E2F